MQTDPLILTMMLFRRQFDQKIKLMKIQLLHQKGLSKKSIAKQLGLSRNIGGDDSA